MLRWLSQTLTVSALSVRTIPQRLASSAVAVIGIAGVVILLKSDKTADLLVDVGGKWPEPMALQGLPGGVNFGPEETVTVHVAKEGFGLDEAVRPPEPALTPRAAMAHEPS